MTFGDYLEDIKAFFIYHGMAYRHIFRGGSDTVRPCHVFRYKMPGVCEHIDGPGPYHEVIVTLDIDNDPGSRSYNNDENLSRIIAVRERIIKHVIYFLHGYSVMPPDPMSIEQEVVRNHAQACTAWRWVTDAVRLRGIQEDVTTRSLPGGLYERHMDTRAR